MSVELSGWRKRQIALDQKAENARELGLDYEPDLIERLRLGDGTSPDHLLLLEAADALEKSVECMCGICKLGPPQREWVGLTEQDRNDIEDYFCVVVSIHLFDAIEAKLKEKNGRKF